MKPKDLYQKAIEKWGEKAQMQMAVEECAELIQALMKYGREINGDDEYKVMQEIADVEIMMEQLREIFGNGDIDNFKRLKLERLERLL